MGRCFRLERLPRRWYLNSREKKEHPALQRMGGKNLTIPGIRSIRDRKNFKCLKNKEAAHVVGV